MLNHTPADFISLITISIASNLAFIIKETKERNTFYNFINIFCKTRIENIQKSVKIKMDALPAKDMYKFDFYVKELSLKKYKTSLETSDQLIQQSATYIDKLTAIGYMSSACLLLGLYGFLVLVLIALFKHSPEECELFLWHSNLVCLIFLLLCVLWDISCDTSNLLAKARNLIKKEGRFLPPRRTNAICWFLVLLVLIVIYCCVPFRYHFFTISCRPAIFHLSMIYTVLTCFSAFILYITIIVAKMSIIRYRFKNKMNRIDEALEIIQSEDFKTWKAPGSEVKIKRSGFSSPIPPSQQSNVANINNSPSRPSKPNKNNSGKSKHFGKKGHRNK